MKKLKIEIPIRTGKRRMGSALSQKFVALAMVTGLVLALGFSSIRTWAEEGISVQSTVNTNTAAVGQAIELIVSVKSRSKMSGLGEPRLPGLEGFDLVSRNQSTQSRMSITNGDIHQEIEQQYHYVLIPQKTGKLKIGEAEIEVDGKSYKTKPIVIDVLKAGQVPKNAQGAKPNTQGRGFPPGFGFDDDDEEEDLFTQILRKRGLLPGMPGAPGAQGNGPGIGQMQGGPVNPNDAFFVRVSVDKNQAYVGEQITASWYLYTRNFIRDIDTLKYPDLKAFWKEDIEVATRLNFQDEVINGIPYKKALLVSYALFPLKEGTGLIDSYKAKCTVAMGGWSGMGQSYTFSKSAPEVKIKVLPLPTQGQPRDFTGAVGQFNLKTSVTSQKIQTGQPFSFKIRIEGRGNAKSIELPPLELPKSVESYDTKTETKFFPTGESYKEFELLLIPREAGNLTLPSVSVSSFDPQSKTYVQKTAPALTIQVFQGSAKESISSRPGATGAEKEKTVAKSLPGLAVWSESPVAFLAPHKSILWGLALLGIAVYLALLFRVEMGIGEKRRNRRVELERRLKKIYEKVGQSDFRSVGALGINAIYSVVGDVSTEGKASVSIDKLLLKIPPSLRQDVEKPMNEVIPVFEALSFAPEGALGNLTQKDNLKEWAKRLEKLLNQIVSHVERDEVWTGKKAESP